MAKECVNCVHESAFKAVECRTCIVGYMDGLQHGLPSNFKPKPKTNADRIRAMSDEELARWVIQFVFDSFVASGIEDPKVEDGTEEAMLKWLKQPAEVDNG